MRKELGVNPNSQPMTSRTGMSVPFTSCCRFVTGAAVLQMLREW